MAPISRAIMPMPTAKRVSNGFTVASVSSTRTTSPMVERPSCVEADAVAELDDGGEAAHAIELGATSCTTPPSRTNGSSSFGRFDVGGEVRETVHSRGASSSGRGA